ncbi:hypothetical protein [Qipengyuania sp.]|uniref:hypothetical protein n=1 Tax=Qipengyuania sp. TaxID=2004515 RepID=UPI0035C7F477
MRILMTSSLAALAFAIAPAMAQDTAAQEDLDNPAPPVSGTMAPTPDETTVDRMEGTHPAPMTDADEANQPPATDPLATTQTPPAAEPVPSPTDDPMAQPLPAEAPADPSAKTTNPTPAEALDAMADGTAPTPDVYRATLSPERQALFDRIAPADQAKIVAMTEAQQEQTWASLEQQAAEQEAAEPEDAAQ